MLRSPRENRRTTGKVGECRRNPMKMRRICATPRLGEELLEKMGIFERTPEKKVETPRKKGEPKKENQENRNQKKTKKGEPFSKGGFTDGLLQAQGRGKVRLISLEDLYRCDISASK